MNLRALLSLLLAIAITIAVSACGGGSSTSSSSADSTSPNSTASKSESIAEAESKHVLSFGHEAEADERDAASKVLEENLRARAGKDWSGQCNSLSARLSKELVERAELISGKHGKGTCAKGLELEAEPVSPSVLKDPMTGPIDVLRVEGPKAYALFQGSEGKEYGMPMAKEGDAWKVDQLTTIEIVKG
jgi:hypothetical protein